MMLWPMVTLNWSQHIVDLMRANIHVAIVTAAGYPGEAERFEQRVAGLLDAFRFLRLPDSVTSRFHIMGGECNYLLRLSCERRLEFVPEAEWKSDLMLGWAETEVQAALDEASAALVATAKHLRLPVQARVYSAGSVVLTHGATRESQSRAHATAAPQLRLCRLDSPKYCGRQHNTERCQNPSH